MSSNPLASAEEGQMAFFQIKSLDQIAEELIARAEKNEELADPKQFRHSSLECANLKATAANYRRAADIIRHQIECEA